MLFNAVPGVGGNRLRAKLNKPCVCNPLCKQRTRDYAHAWVNLNEIIISGMDCLVNTTSDTNNNK